MNQMFVLQANAGALVQTMMTDHAPGYGGQIMGGSHGQSRVVDPNGIVLEQARVFGQQLLIHDLDLTLLTEQRHRMVMQSKDHPVFGQMWQDGLSRFSSMPLEF